MLILALPSVLSVVVVLIGILSLGDSNSRMAELNARMSNMLRTSISELRSHMDNRFDDARDSWRAELRRVEEVIDARLKHIEDR